MISSEWWDRRHRIKNKFLILTYFVGIAIATGCNSIATHLPSTRFESAEVPGHLVWRFGTGGGTSQTVIFSDDGSFRPPTVSPKIATYIEYPLAKASLGLSDHFEVGLKYGFPGPVLAKVKFQVIGDPAAVAKKGNFALSLGAASGFDWTSKGGNQNGTFGPGGYNWSANSTTGIYDFSLITGYRSVDNFIIFGGPFVTAYKLTGNIHQDLSDNGLSPAADYPLSGTGTSYGASLGFQIYFGHRKNLSVVTDITAQRLEWSTTSGQTTLGGGALFEFMLL